MDVVAEWEAGLDAGVHLDIFPTQNHGATTASLLYQRRLRLVENPLYRFPSQAMVSPPDPIVVYFMSS